AGLDATADAGQLVIVALRNRDNFGGSNYAGAVLTRFAIGDNPSDGSGLSVATLKKSGFGNVSVTATNDVTLTGNLELPELGVLRLQSENAAVTLGGSVRAAGGQVVLRSLNADVQVAR
ncbi:hypothetical protein Q6272_28160, partial [Klebsiella pneumoniae]|uniref:hypothetical protein n=1 Tax=Klebsiella pneumoniae TaxID=573 RepID=UPI002731A96C